MVANGEQAVESERWRNSRTRPQRDQMQALHLTLGASALLRAETSAKRFDGHGIGGAARKAPEDTSASHQLAPLHQVRRRFGALAKSYRRRVVFDTSSCNIAALEVLYKAKRGFAHR